MACALCLIVVVCPAAGCNKHSSSRLLERGDALFRDGRYDEAIDALRRAVALNPDDPTAHLYLGYALKEQWRPYDNRPEEKAQVSTARAEFHKVLALEPGNATALNCLASLALKEAHSAPDNMQNWNTAAQWYQRLALANPEDPEAHYQLGRIAGVRVGKQIEHARNKSGASATYSTLKLSGSLRNARVRRDLRGSLGPVIEEGIRNVSKAVELNPEWDDPFAQMAHLIRLRANLADTNAQYRHDISTADNWERKAQGCGTDRGMKR